MIENKYGDNPLCAALPHDWRAGDKPGANDGTTTNDTAIYWPIHQSLVLVTAYLAECAGPEAKRNAVLAEVGRLVVSSLRSE
jgi:beta-lactamase class A